MNNEELRNAVRSAAYEILKTEIAIAPVDLFIKIGILTKKDYEDCGWEGLPTSKRFVRLT